MYYERNVVGLSFSDLIRKANKEDISYKIFPYTPEICRCRYCKYCHEGKCTLKRCCCMKERVRARSCNFTEILEDVFETIKDNVFHFRLRIAEERATELKTCFLDIVKLGNYDVKDLTPLIIQKYITELMQNGNMKTGKGLSSNSINTVIAVIQNSMSIAFDIGITDEYVMDKLKRPKIQEKKITCFSPAEQKIIEQAVINDKRSKMLGIVLCLYTGLRIGELLALEWKDIDFVNHEISVDKTCYDGKNEDGIYCRFTSVPKTDTSTRVIPFPKQLIPLLRNLKRKSSSEYVISDVDKIISVRSYQRSFELLLKKLNIQHRGFHSLRHTFATRALECGMDVKTLSEILGHKNPTVTLHRYAHSMMDHKKEMMNRLGKLL